MLFQIAKAPFVPSIQSSRLTCIGMQYTVADLDTLHVVTTTPMDLTCSCGQAACPHLTVVQVQRAHYAACDAHRTVYTALFDLSYGD